MPVCARSRAPQVLHALTANSYASPPRAQEQARTQPLVVKISRRRFLKTLGVSGAGTLAFGSGYAFAVEPLWRLEVTRYAIAPPRWPKALKLSIAVIADLHAGGPAMP